MQILYGVVGEGMGHATRSRVVLEHLLSRGHEVRVEVSGKALSFLVGRFAGRPGIAFEEIHGLTLDYEGNAVDFARSVLSNLERAPAGLARNLEVYRKVAEEGFGPELVVSDFESWAYLYGKRRRIPVVSIDNMQIINRCRHDRSVTGGRSAAFRIAKAAVKAKLPGAYHYLVTSFFFPPVRKRRTTLVPPILRPEILAARREPGEHVVVYQRVLPAEELVPVLERLGRPFRVYGAGKEGSRGNVALRPFSETGFVEDLRTARAVIAGGGYSLMGEAVHLGVPMLAVPIEGQFEQELNARWLAALGYGRWAKTLDARTMTDFLDGAPDHERALADYPRRDGSVLAACVEELVRLAGEGAPPPDRLATAAMGTFERAAIPAEREEEDDSMDRSDGDEDAG
ncbi:MAG: teichoic acid biosynthesis protein [Planctomycetes bacterium]|nr:teichoic acid biosynthesis protein [Planctomycetota bacterium]